MKQEFLVNCAPKKLQFARWISRAVEQVFERDEERRKQVAEDPSWMPQPSDFEQFFGVQRLSGHVSSIVDGLDEYYHCRRTDCGCITTNSTWPNTVAAGGGQYWCPDPKLNRMRKYRAYPQMYAGQKLMESKKVMVFKDPYKGKG